MLSSNGWHLFLSSLCSASSSHLLLLLVILKMKIGISMRARAFVQCSSGQMATAPDKAPRTTLSIPFLVKSGDLNASFSTLADRTTKKLLKPPIARHHPDPQASLWEGSGMGWFQRILHVFHVQLGLRVIHRAPRAALLELCACVPWGSS